MLQQPCTWFFALALTGCFGGDSKDDTGETTEPSNQPSITVDPELLEFGAVATGESAVDSFYIGNSGGADLQIADIALADGVVDFVLLNETTSITLAPGAEQEVLVSFTPSSSTAVSASAVIVSDDPDRPEATVTFTGNSTPADVQIVFEPDNYDFGTLTTGEWALAELALTNSGEAEVELSALELTGEGFTLLTEPTLPATIDAGSAVIVTVQYAPETEGTHTGQVVAATSDDEEAIASLAGEAEAPEEVTESFRLINPAVDLLFSADQSGSMDDDVRSLATMFPDFVQELEQLTTDWQVIVANDDDGCNNSGILTPTTPNHEATFQTAIQQGGGMLTESLLTVADNAVSEARLGGCNEGWLREGALLHIVFISDEPEQSSLDPLVLVSRIQSSLPDAQQVRISAVAGDYPAGCGSASPGTGYWEATQATEGLFLSICDDMSDNVEELGAASGWAWLFELSTPADPDTLQITIGGMVRATNYTYDEGRNAVLLTEDYPGVGEQVDITYSPAS